MKLAIVLVVLATLYVDCEAWKGKGQLTYYESYAPCCPGNPNYDPSAPTTECDLYSACKYPGHFAWFNGVQQTYNWVRTNNIIAFYDDSDPDGVNWRRNYGGKRIRLTKNGRTYEAMIVDTCGNHDCNMCCKRNSKNGYLVDVEINTARRMFSSHVNAHGEIDFEIV